MGEPAYRYAVVLLAAISAGWMVVDGARALFVGDYFTVDGELGPWAPLVEALGIQARSTFMKAFFLVYGSLWLAATGLFAARRIKWRVMMVFALASAWYLVVGTILALAQVGLLLARERRLAKPMRPAPR